MCWKVNFKLLYILASKIETLTRYWSSFIFLKTKQFLNVPGVTTVYMYLQYITWSSTLWIFLYFFTEHPFFSYSLLVLREVIIYTNKPHVLGVKELNIKRNRIIFLCLSYDILANNYSTQIAVLLCYDIRKFVRKPYIKLE